jgi:hypothetical protein
VSNFEPKGDEARWKIIYPILQGAAIDEVVTYDELGEALSLDPVADRVLIQGVMCVASRKLLRNEDRAVENVRNKGYRIVRPAEQFSLAQKAQKKAKRTLKHGHDLVVHVNYNGMESEDRRRIETGAQLIAAQLAFNRRVDLRLRDHDKALNAIANRQDRTDDESAALRDRVERLERLLGDS